MSLSITKKHGDDATQIELEALAKKAGCMVGELVFKSNDGAGTYTISAPAKKHTAAEKEAIADEAAATARESSTK